MARERIVQKKSQRAAGAEASQEETRFVWSLRPRTLDEYIGQTQLVENLRIAITAARNRGEPLDHLLFHGPPGLGKTTLAHIIAIEMQSKITHTSGPALEKPADIVGILSNLEQGDVLFIDEMHRLSHTVEEYLYSAMEDFKVDFVGGKGAYAKTISLPLKPFTLVGATTRSGLLSAPLRDRFGMIYHLDFYSGEELAQVVQRSASLLRVPIDEAGAWAIARRARGTPRVANRLLRRVRDYVEVMGQGHITQELAEASLSREGVDERGLDRLDRLYLTTLLDVYSGGPVGLEALAATLNEDTSILADVVEPFLLKMALVSRTSAGRRATDLAWEHLGRERPFDKAQDKPGGQPRLL